MLFNYTTTTHTPYILVLHMIIIIKFSCLSEINQPSPSQTPNPQKHPKENLLSEIFTTYFPSISTFLPPFIAVCLWLLWYNILILFSFHMFIYLFIFYDIFFISNTILVIIEVECAVVSEVTPSILSLTLILILYPYTFPPLHTLFSFIPTDHEIAHQWSGNPYSWDSIYQHQRKPQRLLVVKLMTNRFNTKSLTSPWNNPSI